MKVRKGVNEWQGRMTKWCGEEGMAVPLLGNREVGGRWRVRAGDTRAREGVTIGLGAISGRPAFHFGATRNNIKVSSLATLGLGECLRGVERVLRQLWVDPGSAGERGRCASHGKGVETGQVTGGAKSVHAALLSAQCGEN